MRVETELIHRSLGNETDKSGFKAEWKTWTKLFKKKKYRDRTMIGITVMVFQRASFPLALVCPHKMMNDVVCLFRMEWYQCITVLWANNSSKHRITRRYSHLVSLRRYKRGSILSRSSLHSTY